MKRIICILLIALLSVSLFACDKKADEVQKPNSDTNNSEKQSALVADTGKSDLDTQSTAQDKSVSIRIANDSKVFNMNSDDGKAVRNILSKADFKVNPLDNISDIVINVDGKNYSYDSENGIFTYSDEKTEINRELTAQLSDSDMAEFDKIISKYMIIKNVEEPSAINRSDKIVHDDFIIKEKSNTLLTMAKYDKKSGQVLKSALYSGDYGKLDNASTLNIKVGDVITVYYDENVMETYPCQIIIRKIIETANKQTESIVGNDSVSVVDIIDIAKRDKIPLAQAIEWFYSDSAYKYYYPCIKSKYVLVRYSDGSKETAESALKNGKITISDLDKFDIEYGKEKR